MHTIGPTSRSWPLALLASLLAVAVYAPTWGYGFAYDDLTLLGSSARIRDGSFQDAISTTFFDAQDADKARIGYYRPALVALYWAEARLSGVRPWLFHVTSTLLHGVATCLVFVLAIRLLGSRPLALASSALFATHPMHVDAVAFIGGRTDLLATVFALAAVLASDRRHPSGGLRHAAYPLFLLALFSKEVALAAPLLVVTLDLLGEPLSEWRRILRERVPVYVGYTATLSIYVAVRLLVLGHLMPYHREVYSADEKLFLVPLTVGQYVQALFFPVTHRVWRTLEDRSTLGLSAALVVPALVLVGLGVLLWLRRRDGATRMAGALMLLGLLPSANIVSIPTHFYFAEARLYLPSVGFALLAAAVVGRAIEWLPEQRKLVVFATLGVLGLYVWGLEGRTPIWRDHMSFVQTVAAENPDSSAVRFDLAVTLHGAGHLDGAIHEMERARDLDRTNVKAWRRLAELYLQAGRTQDALEAATAAVAVKPEARSYLNMSAVFDAMGQFEDSAAAAGSAIREDPNMSDAHFNLGRAHRRLGRLNEALTAFEAAMSLDPADAAFKNSSGLTLMDLGRAEEAIALYREAVRQDPGNTMVRHNLAVALVKIGRREEARVELEILKEHDPTRGAALEKILLAP